MTKREMLVAVINGEMNEEIMEVAKELLESMDSSNAKRREKAAEKRAVKLEAEKVLEDAILEMLGEEPVTASQIRDAIDGIETSQKATVIVKRLVAEGKAVQTELKTNGRKVKGYIAG